MSANGTILISKLFAGGYLYEGENIGHEAINYLPAFDGKKYLFIPNGSDISRYKEIDAVLFVRYLRKRGYEVLACAKGPILPVSLADNIEGGDISFGDLFSRNTYRSEADESLNRIWVVDEDNYFVPKKEDFTLPRKVDNHELVQRVRRYYSKSDFETGLASSQNNWYETLRSIIGNKDNWEKPQQESMLPKSNAKGCGDLLTRQSFLEVIHKEYDELVFSNLLAHYFRFTGVVDQFAKEVLGPNISQDGGEWEVRREYKHIDLWLENSTNIIVIENKIRSGINGLSADGSKSQLDNYIKVVEDESKEHPKNAGFFLFVPDYEKTTISEHVSGTKYTLIPYSKLFTFFKEHRNLCDDEFFDEFLIGLERHACKSLSALNWYVMRRRIARLHKDRE